MRPIPQEWIGKYVYEMLQVAAKFDDGPMRAAAALRADHAIDLVKAWREYCEKN